MSEYSFWVGGSAANLIEGTPVFAAGFRATFYSNSVFLLLRRHTQVIKSQRHLQPYILEPDPLKPFSLGSGAEANAASLLFSQSPLSERVVLYVEGM